MSLKYFKRYRMEIDLHEPIAAPRLRRGYRLVPWNKHALAGHAEATFASFQGEIDASLFDCLADRASAHRLMEAVFGRVGFLPDATWLAVYEGAPHKPEVCGAIQGVRSSPSFGAIQNVGVTPFHRGRGVGAALVAAALRGMQLAGLPNAYLEVTGANKGAIRLYHKLGFRMTGTLYRAVERALV
ncbi:Mycothiol acetyltransferase [Pirellulimonas nuda]|uniref:Mycothiol acetyltransferase n=1 Tax=Pirellulimonas nuda TaxID=2528009 RepID=A0A518DEM6_9BACT|nr:GNAT family N-acetyltransferase [Pirellulimonas nuda]QDU89931.1 Mycothiol acetyltransferase [Pirellulimonas nuda]